MVFSRRNDIKHNIPPQIMFYGDSFITRLKQWDDTYKGDDLPHQWDREILKNAKYVFLGGSIWRNVHLRVQGINVPQKQTQGNTWLQAIQDEYFDPTAVFFVCGGK